MTDMEIKWLGHSCFRIKGKYNTIITDPYSQDFGYSLGKPSADIITVSHQHPGHNYTAGIAGNPKIVDGPGEYEFLSKGNLDAVIIIGVATYHDNQKGEERGKNTVYLIEIDDISICHLGDLGHTLTDEQVEEIGNVDVLLLPVGGKSTIGAAAAAEVVRQLEPKAVIPMHFQNEAKDAEFEPVSKFLKEIGTNDVASQPKLSVTRTSLPPSTKVFLLEC